MDKDGVIIYTKLDDESTIKSFKGITQVDAYASDVVALIMDYDRYDEWVDAVSSVRVIQMESDTTYFIQVKIKLPFPVSDRDIVQRIEINQPSDTTFYISISTVAELIPEEKGYIRMPLSDGHWKIRQLKDHLTDVELVSINDPGGSIPKWLIKMMATDSPFKTLKNMRSIFED
jgi:ribosome-associated toxin RatA of RatAB toxin-antitoxin module